MPEQQIQDAAQSARTALHALQYPATGAEVLVEHHRVKPGVRRAIRTFARAGAWRGTVDERFGKLWTLHETLCVIYRVTVALEFEPGIGDSGASSCQRLGSRRYRIRLINRLSVITYLHEFGHALGRDEYGACRWSLNLFRRHFPLTWARCQFAGHFVSNPQRTTAKRLASPSGLR